MYVFHWHAKLKKYIFLIQTLQIQLPGSWLAVPSHWPVEPQARAQVVGRR